MTKLTSPKLESLYERQKTLEAQIAKEEERLALLEKEGRTIAGETLLNLLEKTSTINWKTFDFSAFKSFLELYSADIKTFTTTELDSDNAAKRITRWNTTNTWTDETPKKKKSSGKKQSQEKQSNSNEVSLDSSLNDTAIIPETEYAQSINQETPDNNDGKEEEITVSDEEKMQGSEDKEDTLKYYPNVKYL